MRPQKIEKRIPTSRDAQRRQRLLQFMVQFASSHTGMPLADGLHQFEDELLFRLSLLLPLFCLVMCLAADTIPAAGRLLADLPAGRRLLYDFFPKFFLRSTPSAWLATSIVVVNIRFSRTLSANADSSSATRLFSA